MLYSIFADGFLVGGFKCEVQQVVSGIPASVLSCKPLWQVLSQDLFVVLVRTAHEPSSVLESVSKLKLFNIKSICFFGQSCTVNNIWQSAFI